jgi:hypothetical protein
LNGGSSSSSSSENKSNGSPSQPYSRLIYPQASENRCSNGMKHILDDHARLAQSVTVR